MSTYTYKEATCRNIGILSEKDQETLSKVRVAVPGVGGLGGTQVMIMTRLGIKNFNLADYDKYDVSNFNRQYGATVDTIGSPKIEVMANHVKSVHPDSDITYFYDGITEENVEQFVASADFIFDAIDLTAMDARELLYKEARKQGKFVVACGPVGYGFFCLTLDPNGMSYEEAFSIPEDCNTEKKISKFIEIITPDYLHSEYMSNKYVHPTFVPGEAREFSWISPAIYMAAGNGVSELLKIILKKGNVMSIPNVYQYDAFTNRLSISKVK